MKKWFTYALLVGLVSGIAYFISKKKKQPNNVSVAEKRQENSEPIPPQQENQQPTNVVEDMREAKMQSAQIIQERHVEAGEIIKDTYQNVMEDFVVDYSYEKTDNKGPVIDEEDISVMKKLNSISSNIDDMLK